MINLDELGQRKNGDLLTTFHGLESGYDAKARRHTVYAVMSTAEGTGHLVGTSELMALQMNFNLLTGSPYPPANMAQLRAEDELAQSTYLKITAAQERIGLEDVRGINPKNRTTEASTSFPGDVRLKAAEAIAHIKELGSAKP